MFLSDFSGDKNACKLFISLLCTYLYHRDNSSLSNSNPSEGWSVENKLTEKVRSELGYYNEEIFNIYFEADSEDREELHLEELNKALKDSEIKRTLIGKLLEDDMELGDLDTDSLLETLSGIPEGIIWSVREVTRRDCYSYRDQGGVPDQETAQRIIFELCDLFCFVIPGGELEQAFLTGVCQALEVDSRHIDDCKSLLQNIYDEHEKVRAALADLSNSSNAKAC